MNLSRKTGFTLVELLMVILIITVLVAILLPVLNPSKSNAKAKEQVLDRKTIAAALRSYKSENMRWPIPDLGVGDYSNNNYLVVEVLNSVTGALRFLESGGYRKTENGSLKDPYGVPYCISFPDENTAKVDGTSVEDY